MRIRAFILGTLFFAFISGNAIAEIDNTTLVEKLRQGGYVILVRHAITDQSQSDTDPDNLDNCGAQRNLNQAGRDQSASIGEAIKALNIPVGKVYSSLYCRCIETAELAFGKPETTLDLSSFMRETKQEKTRRVDVIKHLLATYPDPETNNFLVTHKVMLNLASGVHLLEGGAAVFKPEGDLKFQLVALVPSNRWQAMLDTVSEKDEF